MSLANRTSVAGDWVDATTRVAGGGAAATTVAGGGEAATSMAGGVDTAMSETSEGDGFASDSSLASDDSGLASPDILGHLHFVQEAFSERFKILTDHMIKTDSENTLHYVQLSQRCVQSSQRIIQNTHNISQIVVDLGQIREYLTQEAERLEQAKIKMDRM